MPYFLSLVLLFSILFPCVQLFTFHFPLASESDIIFKATGYFVSLPCNYWSLHLTTPTRGFQIPCAQQEAEPGVLHTHVSQPARQKRFMGEYAFVKSILLMPSLRNIHVAATFPFPSLFFPSLSHAPSSARFSFSQSFAGGSSR